MWDSVCARLWVQRERVGPCTRVRAHGENVGTWAGDVKCLCRDSPVYALAGLRGGHPEVCPDIWDTETSKALRTNGGTGYISPCQGHSPILRFSDSPAHWHKPAWPGRATESWRLPPGPGHVNREAGPAQPPALCLLLPRPQGEEPPDGAARSALNGAGSHPEQTKCSVVRPHAEEHSRGCAGTSKGLRQALRGGAHSCRGETERGQI